MAPPCGHSRNHRPCEETDASGDASDGGLPGLREHVGVII